MSEHTLPITTDSLRLRLTSRKGEDRQSVLEELARGYWRPLYSYARGLGQDEEQAKDAVQSFFHHLITRDILSRYNPESEGRLRGWLSTIFKNHLLNGIQRTKAEKRGGGLIHQCFDVPEIEKFYQQGREHLSATTPELLYDHSFAQEVWTFTLTAVRASYEARGRAHIFDTLKGHLRTRLECEGANTDPLLKALRVRETARVRLEMHRLRDAVKQTFNDRVIQLSGPEYGEEEIEYLWQLIA